MDTGVIGISLDEAAEMILDHIKEVKGREELALLDAYGRVTAETVRAEFDNPPFSRSPLDGYAFAASASAGASAERPVTLPVVDCIYAGCWRAEPVPEGSAVRIMTGAPIPPGCDCVIRLEDVNWEPATEQSQEPATEPCREPVTEPCREPATEHCCQPAAKESAQQENLAGGTVTIPMEMKPWENYCFCGEDFKKGTELLAAGEQLDAVGLGILASAGRTQVEVVKRPKLAILVTGDEVALPGQKLLPGQLYGSNLHLIYGRLKELGMDVAEAAQAPDDPEQVAEMIREMAARGIDGLITTGGVSVGDKDIFHQVLPVLGAERLFWRVKLKPGTPMMFALYQGLPMFHLSGNPFAALVTFDLLVRPALAKLSGNRRLKLIRTTAVMAEGFVKESRQRRFIRGYYDGETVSIESADRHSSGILASTRGCNCLIDIPAGSRPLKKGDRAYVVLL